LRYFIYLFLIVLILIFSPFLITFENEKINPDLLLVLGGGKEEYRLKKSLEYYMQNLPLSKKIIFTGGNFTYLKTNPKNSRIAFFNNAGIDRDNILHVNTVENTIEEIIYLKDFMIKYGYKKVSIITDRYHLTRVILLTKLLNYEKYSLQVYVVESDYYKDYPIESLFYSFLDNIKIYYNYLKYNLFL
jgi:uncharacterized SAM-binding protein YcdF (DUF218 family)